MIKLLAYTVSTCWILIIALPLCAGYNRGPQPVKQDIVVLATQPQPTLPPCRPKGGSTMSDIKRHMLITHNKIQVTGNDVMGRTYYWKPEVNCTDGDGTSVEPVEYDHWKLHIIMACTVTAAVEFVLIIFIILYWKQIRWTLRKLTCPCDNCHQHEAMEPEDIDEQETHDIGIIEMGSVSKSRPDNHSIGTRDHCGPTVQTFSAPWNSRVQSGDEAEDLAVPGPSGLNVSISLVNLLPFQSLDRKFSSSDDSLSGDDSRLVVVPVSPSTKPPLPVKSRKRQSNCSKLSELSESGISPSSTVNTSDEITNSAHQTLEAADDRPCLTTCGSSSAVACDSELECDTTNCPLWVRAGQMKTNQILSADIPDQLPIQSNSTDNSLISDGQVDNFKSEIGLDSQSGNGEAETNLVHTVADVHCESPGGTVSLSPGGTVSLSPGTTVSSPPCGTDSLSPVTSPVII